MKTICMLAVLLVFIGCASAVGYAAELLRAPVDRKTFLRALDQVESGGRDKAVGGDGERGRYQITRAVWSQHTRKPFELAHKRVFAHAVAEQHFDWIARQLIEADWPVDVESVAMAWNAGLTATINNRVPSSTKDYAKRIENLYNEYRKEARKS